MRQVRIVKQAISPLRRPRRGHVATVLLLAACGPSSGSVVEVVSRQYDHYEADRFEALPTKGDPADSQCDPARGFGFTLHGLWPQYEEGWPADCETEAADPSRRQTSAMADIMGSGGLAWYQWKKHGRCTDLAPESYFGVLRRAFGALRLPEPAERTDARAVAAAFLKANPGMPADGLVVTCREGLLREVRICLTKDLQARSCGADVLADACRPDRPLAAPEAP